MRFRKASLSHIALLALLAGGVDIALAHQTAPDGGPWHVARRGGGTSLDAAVARIQRETGGRVLSAETVRRDGDRVHRIKVLLPSGKVRVYHVDAGD